MSYLIIPDKRARGEYLMRQYFHPLELISKAYSLSNDQVEFNQHEIQNNTTWRN